MVNITNSSILQIGRCLVNVLTATGLFRSSSYKPGNRAGPDKRDEFCLLFTRKISTRLASWDFSPVTVHMTVNGEGTILDQDYAKILFIAVDVARKKFGLFRLVSSR